MRSTWNTTLEQRNQAQKVVDAYEEERCQREEGGKNWNLHFQMQELRKTYWQGLRFLPNLKEINSEEFAAHPCISGSYSSRLLGSTSTEHIPGMVHKRYAQVMLNEVNSNAGHGVAFVAVPATDTPEEWSKSQHNTVPLKLRHWSFHICDHKFRGVLTIPPRNCIHTYRCEHCDWTYEIDSSG